MNTYTDEEITKGLNQERIDIAIEVLKHINFRSTYGHNATYCAASNKMLGLLKSLVTKRQKETNENINKTM